MTNDAIQRAVRYALLASATTAAAGASTAFAQDQGGGDVEEVVVTGSRIPQPNLESISPVTVVGAEEVALSGVTRVEDLVNNLPQAVADFGGNLSNGATGASTVSLRGLGANRTLVLVDGRRLMPGDPTQNGNGAPDLNQIPSALIQRVEVLTGGASAVYGADAVAGVVNFILKKDFEGLQFSGQYSIYQHDNDNAIAGVVQDSGFGVNTGNVSDGNTQDYTVALGINGAEGRGNATVYAGYRELDAVQQSRRDYSACALGSGDAFSCAGSSTAAPGRFFETDQATGAPIGAGFTIGADNELVPWSGSDAFNFAPLNYYQRPDKRYTAGLLSHYEVNQFFDAYAEFMFMDDRTFTQVAPSGAFLGSGPNNGAYVVNCDNPFLSASQVQAFCTSQGLGPTSDALVQIGRRNVEGGGRQDDFRHTSFRAVLGGRGDLTDAWSYDVYVLYGQTNFSQTFLRDFSSRRVGNALLAVRDPADPANVVCRVNVDTNVANDDPNCVPWNIFQLGGVTPEALGYLQTPGFQDGRTVEEVYSASFTGDLGEYRIKLPWADDGIGVAFGVEYRREESETRNDIAFSSGDLLGQGGAQLNIAGSFFVKELFTEARVPLVQGRKGIEDLTFETGYRYSDYSLGFDTDTYKLGLDWSPIADLRLRSSYQRAVRAPNIVELFRPQVVQLDGNTDPCANDPDTNALPSVADPLATPENCARTGVLPGQYGNIIGNSAAQYNGLTGGNPDLQPETADTVSFGIVATPAILPRSNFAIDYYRIRVKDVIDVVGADLILNQCLASGDPQFCGLINRAPGSGSLWLGPQGYVTDLNFNLGSLETRGVDTEINYSFDFRESQRLSFNFIGTYVDKFVTQPLGTAPDRYDCTGLYGTVCLVPTPEWRHKLRATWQTPWRFSLSAAWRYIGSVDLDATDPNPQLSGEVPPTDARLPSFNYFDVAGEVNITENVLARLGINNITDKDPPAVGQDNCPSVYCNGNTFPQVYESLGRYGFLNVTATF